MCMCGYVYCVNMRMCVCVCECVDMCMCACVYVCTCVYVWMCVFVQCMYTSICVSMHVYKENFSEGKVMGSKFGACILDIDVYSTLNK